MDRNRYWDVVDTVLNLILFIPCIIVSHIDQQMHIIGFTVCK